MADKMSDAEIATALTDLQGWDRIHDRDAIQKNL